MKEEEIVALKFWIDQNMSSLEQYIESIDSAYPAIRLSQIMDCLIKAMKEGDSRAINLGINFILENKKVCFGVSIKTSILSALKTHSDKVTSNQKKSLSLLTASLLSLKYPPREIKWYCKLLKKFGSEYYTLIWNEIEVNSKEAERWIEYFEKETK